MNIKKLLIFFISIFLVSLLTAEQSSPNIVMIISDDHDNEHLGFMGNKTVKTPHIDKLAEAGTVFTTCHLSSSRCRPSLATLLSGFYPHQSGIYANSHNDVKGSIGKINDKEKLLDPANSLPSLLKGAGYATFTSGKYWEGYPSKMGFTNDYGSDTKRIFGSFARKGQQNLFDFVDENAGKKPMFIWWAPLMPHTPHNPPQRFLDMFDPETIPIPKYIKKERREEFLKKEHLSLAMEAWTDEEVGKLRQKMIDSKQDKNTLWVFLIDNGWSNGLPAKGSIYEKGFNTPVFFTWPGKIPKGKKRDDLIQSIDLYPTLLDYAGVKASESRPGINLKPSISSGKTVNRKKIFGAMYPSFGREFGKYPEKDVYALYLRTDKWKYVLYTRDLKEDIAQKPWKIHHLVTDAPIRDKGDENLYDLSSDPYEFSDLSDNHKSMVQEFKKEVLQWWAATGGKNIP